MNFSEISKKNITFDNIKVTKNQDCNLSQENTILEKLQGGRGVKLTHLSLFRVNKFAGLKAYSFIKKILQHKCFPVKFAKFLRTPFLTEHLEWLLLDQPRNIIKTAF